MDPACRQKIYCGPSAGTMGVTGEDAFIRATIHLSASSLSPRSSAVYETDRKKCKLREGYNGISPRSEGKKSR